MLNTIRDGDAEHRHLQARQRQVTQSFPWCSAPTASLTLGLPTTFSGAVTLAGDVDVRRQRALNNAITLGSNRKRAATAWTVKNRDRDGDLRCRSRRDDGAVELDRHRRHADARQQRHDERGDCAALLSTSELTVSQPLYTTGTINLPTADTMSLGAQIGGERRYRPGAATQVTLAPLTANRVISVTSGASTGAGAQPKQPHQQHLRRRLGARHFDERRDYGLLGAQLRWVACRRSHARSGATPTALDADVADAGARRSMTARSRWATRSR